MTVQFCIIFYITAVTENKALSAIKKGNLSNLCFICYHLFLNNSGYKNESGVVLLLLLILLCGKKYADGILLKY